MMKISFVRIREGKNKERRLNPSRSLTCSIEAVSLRGRAHFPFIFLAKKRTHAERPGRKTMAPDLINLRGDPRS